MEKKLTPETAEHIREFDRHAQELLGCDLHTYMTEVQTHLHAFMLNIKKRIDLSKPPMIQKLLKGSKDEIDEALNRR